MQIEIDSRDSLATCSPRRDWNDAAARQARCNALPAGSAPPRSSLRSRRRLQPLRDDLTGEREQCYSQIWHLQKPTGQTGLVCIVRVELEFCKESFYNPNREGIRLSRPINIKSKAD